MLAVGKAKRRRVAPLHDERYRIQWSRLGVKLQYRTTEQPSGAPDAKQAAKIRVEFDRRTPTLHDSVPGLLGGRRNASVVEQAGDAVLTERRCLRSSKKLLRPVLKWVDCTE
jgi:hypothetical protein